MADPVQVRAKNKRLAEALRANLRRRKEQGKDRTAVTPDADANENTQVPADAEAGDRTRAAKP